MRSMTFSPPLTWLNSTLSVLRDLLIYKLSTAFDILLIRDEALWINV